MEEGSDEGTKDGTDEDMEGKEEDSTKELLLRIISDEESLLPDDRMIGSQMTKTKTSMTKRQVQQIAEPTTLRKDIEERVVFPF